MRIYHLNCGTLCPPGGSFMDGTRRLGRARLVCHCLLVEVGDRLVLVDTGLGLGDVEAPSRRLSSVFLGLLRPKFSLEETAAMQVEQLGYARVDVTDVVLTSLEFEHAGGLGDFPAARVHTLSREHEAASRRSGMIARGRYRPAQWKGEVRWRLYVPGKATWQGFHGVVQPEGLPPDVLMVPLAGHSAGHCGVAVRDGMGWQLLAGDAYFHAGELAEVPWCPPGLRAYQWMTEVDREQRLSNQARLRELRRRAGNEVRVFCSHDASEWEPWAAAGTAGDAEGAEGGEARGRRRRGKRGWRPVMA